MCAEVGSQLQHAFNDGKAGKAGQFVLAALAGRPMHYRAQLSTFDAVLRVVRANLGITVAPVEIAAPYAEVLGLSVIPLNDEWALRRFAICYRSDIDLPPAARLLVDFLESRGKANEFTQGERRSSNLPF